MEFPISRQRRAAALVAAVSLLCCYQLYVSGAATAPLRRVVVVAEEDGRPSIVAATKNTQTILKERASPSSSSDNSNWLATTRPKHANLDLPQWLQDYVVWHAQMRSDFPDEQLLSDSNDSPKVVIRICPHTCNGLHDRMTGLPHYLYDAYKTKRVLLLKWYNRFDLESFLIPAATNYSTLFNLNWTLPHIPNVTTSVEELISSFPYYESAAAVNATKTNASAPIVVKHLRRIWRKPPPSVIQWPNFGAVWFLFFQPSPRLLQLMSSSLLQHSYSALHLRVRHPGQFQRRRDLGTDRNGLRWHKARERQGAITVAIHALNCTRNLLTNNESVYIFSDSEDLVRYLTSETDGNYSLQYSQNDANRKKKSVYQVADEMMQNLNLFTRPSPQQGVVNAHLDSYFAMTTDHHTGQQQNISLSWEAYAGAFVDLYVAIHARCLVLGVGNFAVLAYKIANHSCVLQYANRWGAIPQLWGYQSIEAPYCAAAPA